MALTYDQAIDALRNTPATQEALLDLVRQMSVRTEGAVTLLYSGNIADGIRSSDVITQMINNGDNIRVLDNTDAFKLLNSRDFVAKVGEAFGVDLADMLDPNYRGLATNWLYDGTEGPWANISSRFATATVGEVRTLTPFADFSRVFGATELTQVLSEGSSVTHLNGYQVSDLRRMVGDLTASGKSPEVAQQLVFDMLNEVSKNDASLLKLALDADGRLTSIGTAQYFSNAGFSGMGHNLPDGISGVAATELINAKQVQLPPQQLTDVVRNAELANGYMQQYEAERFSVAKAAGDLDGMARSARYLNRLGVVGAVLGASLVASEANAAYQSGDTAEAQQILAKYAAESAGSWVGGAGMGTLAAPLLAFGPAGWAAWGVLTIGGGIVGGMVGENVAGRLIDASNTPTQPEPTQIPYSDGSGMLLETGYSNGVVFGQYRSNVIAPTDADSWRIPLSGGGYRTVVTYLNPELNGGIAGYTEDYDAEYHLVLSERRTLLSSGTGMQTQAFDAGQNLLATRVQQVVGGKTVDATFGYDANGAPMVVKINGINGQPVADGTQVVEALNAAGLTPEQLATGVLTEQAETTLSVYDPTQPSGIQTLLNGIATYGSPIIDAFSLIRAIQSGEPLPILASGLRLANDLSILNGTPNINLSGAANAASGILSLLSLNAALERGDTLGAVTAGAQALSFGATAYTEFLIAQNGGDVFEAVAQNLDVFQFAQGLGKALPVLNLINSIANGDAVGTAVAAVSMIPGMQWVGVAYAIFNIISSLFGDDDEVPDPWGNGRFVWNGTGISIQSAGETGGNEAVRGVMGNVVTVLNSLIEQVRQQNPGSALGIIPNRMPSLGYDMSGFRYTDIDPLTGAEQHPGLRFDTSGRPYNAATGSPESFQSLIEGVARSALSRGAIAPLWEVQTAKAQTDAGDPRAGLTEEERAGRAGQLAAAITGTTQVFRPVALDLDGDGIETTDKAHGVAFDVDDSGFLKQSAWLNSDDAFLTLDRDYNGQVDSGRELFSNGEIALGRRGLAGMAWVDSNYDGKLTAADPVWSELKVWRDADQDGVQELGESQGLTALGISELNYAMGTFTQAGQQKQLASPDLEADKEGSRISIVPEGILVQNSADHKLSLLVTRIDDLTALEANRDGITGYEDVEAIVSTVDLLANDALGGFTGRDLSITEVSNFRHGSGFLDANGFVHFNPEADYSGTEAGFDYRVQAVNDGRWVWAA